MRITLDQQAEDILTKKIGDQPGQVRLLYDTEGCGCYGITSFQIISKPDSTDVPIENESFPFWVDPQRAVFYEDQLRLKGDPMDGSFRLEGDSQIYGQNVKLNDIRSN
ncbi:hypothetical protein D3C73_348030 [compost metagenome]